MEKFTLMTLLIETRAQRSHKASLGLMTLA